MPAIKRPAEDSILPLRAPKQPKRTPNHPLGGNSSPSQYEALLARWSNVSLEFLALMKDTVLSVIGSGRDACESLFVSPPAYHPTANGNASGTIPSPPPSPPLAPPPRALTSTARRASSSRRSTSPRRSSPPRRPTPPRLPTRTRIPALQMGPATSSQYSKHSSSAPAATNIHRRMQSGQPNVDVSQPPIRPKYAPPRLNAVASTSKTTLPVPDDAKVSGFPGGAQSTGLMSPPSTQASESSIRSVVTQKYPEVAVALQEARRRRKRFAKYIERPHIHAKEHKARVEAENKKMKEEMEMELYSLKRSRGFGSDFESFHSLLSYQAHLERLEKTSALSPSSSLVDLRSRAKHDETRRHSSPDHVDMDFLQRAIRKAQETLKGPKPPKPFIPTLDQLRLKSVHQDKQIEERLRPKRKPLPTSLPPADEAEVEALFRQRGVIAKCVKEQVSNEDIQRLRPAQWLNDEIINFYGQLILSRSEECKENPGGVANGRKPLNVHYFNTFFWSKLRGQGYEGARLAKWTKKIDIFSKDVILVPVNHNNAHWTAAAINFRKKRIESYDSMGMTRAEVFKLLRQYMDEEHRNKKKKPFDFTGWEDYTLLNTPQQENGYDCGVFTCQFLESLSRGEESFAFTQSNMQYLRRKMVWEIGHIKLRSDT